MQVKDTAAIVTKNGGKVVGAEVFAQQPAQPATRANYKNDFDEYVMDYDIGDRVRSPQFGAGEIIDIDGLAVTVQFGNVTKKLNVEYARLEKVA